MKLPACLPCLSNSIQMLRCIAYTCTSRMEIYELSSNDNNNGIMQMIRVHKHIRPMKMMKLLLFCRNKHDSFTLQIIVIIRVFYFSLLRIHDGRTLRRKKLSVL